MKWVAALGTFSILFGLLMLSNYTVLVPAFGINVATVICFGGGCLIGMIAVMTWQAVDLWERGY